MEGVRMGRITERSKRMDKDTRTALKWVGAYLLTTVLAVVIVGAYLLASGLWS